MMDLIREHWSGEDYQQFRRDLIAMGEEAYRSFSQKLIPDTEGIIGIRTPLLRKMAKEIARGNYREYLECEKGTLHEEIIIEGLVMTNLKLSYEELLACMRYYAPKITNWAACDIVSFKRLKCYREAFLKDVDAFIFSENPWVQRFGYGCLMQFYLEDTYIDTVLEKVRAVNSGFYYVQMMQAWLLATAMAKCEEKTYRFLQTFPVSETVMKMTVRKIRESLRVSKECKDLCRDTLLKR